jgi:hypothetical protein
MNDFVTQIVCGARGFNIEDNGWVQLLVFVVVAVIYALGSIAKMRKVKTGEGEEPAGGLPHTPGTGYKAAIRFVSATRTADKSDRRPKVASVEVAQVQPAPISSPPPAGQVMELATRTGSELEIKGVPIPSEVPVPAYLAGILSDYADPEKVRKVILHYEILGKPLSLRESPENIIGP